MDFDKRIAEDKKLLDDLEHAIPKQRGHIAHLHKEIKEMRARHRLELATLTRGITSANSILNRLIKSRREIKNDLRRAKNSKSAYPSRCRAYTKKNLGIVLNNLFERVEK